MSVDAYGNYIADVAPVWTPASGLVTTGALGRGHGPPDANTPLWIYAYIDEDASALYINVDGTTTGWTFVTSPTGVSEVFHGSGAPAFSPVSTTALYIDSDDGTLYYWYDAAWH